MRAMGLLVIEGVLVGIESNKSGGRTPEQSSANTSSPLKKPDQRNIGKIALRGGKK